MSIAQEVTKRQLDIAASTRMCKFGHVLRTLDQEDREAVQYVIDQINAGNKDFTIAWLHSVIAKEHDLGKTAVSTHLARTCTCDRSQ